MAVIGTCPLQGPGRVEGGQLRVEPASDHDEFEPRLGGQLEDQRMRVDGEQAGARGGARPR